MQGLLLQAATMRRSTICCFFTVFVTFFIGGIVLSSWQLKLDVEHALSKVG
jgi:hypothetical protein